MILALAALLCAQPADSPRISVTAVGKVEKMPTSLQVMIPLFASGEGTAKAIEALEAKRSAAVAKLKALGADEKDVASGTPSVLSTSSGSDRRQNPSMRLRKKKDDAGAEAEKEPVVVSRMITVQLPLKGKTQEELLVESEAVRARVKAAGIVEPPKEGDPAGEAEATAMAALAEQGGHFPDGMAISFSATVDEKDRAEAAAKAMVEADKLAALGARAAKGNLGGVLKVEVGGGSEGGEMDQMWRYYNRRGMPVPNLPESEGRLTGTADGLSVTLMLKVEFALLMK